MVTLYLNPLWFDAHMHGDPLPNPGTLTLHLHIVMCMFDDLLPNPTVMPGDPLPDPSFLSLQMLLQAILAPPYDWSSHHHEASPTKTVPASPSHPPSFPFITMPASLSVCLSGEQFVFIFFCCSLEVFLTSTVSSWVWWSFLFWKHQPVNAVISCDVFNDSLTSWRMFVHSYCMNVHALLLCDPVGCVLLSLSVSCRGSLSTVV